MSRTASGIPLRHLPNACAVRPPVPPRRNPKFQYSMSKSIVPMEMPPMSVAAGTAPEAPR